jgi:hypothetical protein
MSKRKTQIGSPGVEAVAKIKKGGPEKKVERRRRKKKRGKKEKPRLDRTAWR